ncbi:MULTISPECIES: hypothetical protein [unclassified Okeania]|uniref:hypothetical protein n=1 Tax=unclassified Okeania TaxID=2634635 RepID=UPI00257FE12B|nr:MULTISPECIES: hypothetical protein [unclassified Okeania]
MYKTGEKKLLNADVNGAFNIIRKVIPDVFDQGIKGLPFNPVVLEPLRMTILSDFLVSLVERLIQLNVGM